MNLDFDLSRIYFFYLLSLKLSVNAIVDNVDTKHAIIFSYQFNRSYDGELFRSSYFGSSIAVNQVDSHNNTILLIGASRYESEFYKVNRSGSIFACEWNDLKIENEVLCSQVKIKEVTKSKKFYKHATHKMCLGGTVISIGDDFVACAHTWVNHRDASNPVPTGKCFILSNNRTTLDEKLFFAERGNSYYERRYIPEHKKLAEDGQPYYSHLMTGFSATRSKSGEMVFGTPGYYDFIGTALKSFKKRQRFDPPIRELDKFYENYGQTDFNVTNSYAGYSLATISLDTNEYIVTGMPRGGPIFEGQVLRFPLDFNSHEMIKTLKGVHPGEYFGASLLVLDINNDNHSDLIIGAPLYSNQQHREAGRIYVYINDGKTPFFSSNASSIVSTNVSRSRFGSSLAAIDIDLDNFDDAVIGAPYERNSDDSTGAVYIFRGSAHGLQETPFKKIGAESIQTVKLHGFGISIITNTDFDRNGYHDILIGSYLSEHAVLLRNKPVAYLVTTINSTKIKLSEKCTAIPNANNSCFIVNYCISYSGKNISNIQKARVTLEISESNLKYRETRAYIHGNENTRTIQLQANSIQCYSKDDSFLILVKNKDQMEELSVPVEIKLFTELIDETDTFCKQCPVADIKSTTCDIEFDYGCKNIPCMANLELKLEAKANFEIEKKKIVEGSRIDFDIIVFNKGEASINTLLYVTLDPSFDILGNQKCKNVSSHDKYECQFNKVLESNEEDRINLKFDVTNIPSNLQHLIMNLTVKSLGSQLKGGLIRKNLIFDIIRIARIRLFKGQSINDFRVKDKEIPFNVLFGIKKEGPSFVDSIHLEILFPTHILSFKEFQMNKSRMNCTEQSSGQVNKSPVIINDTLYLDCKGSSEYCSTQLCEVPNFSFDKFVPLNLYGKLIPSKINAQNYKRIHVMIETSIKINNDVKYENPISANTQLLLSFTFHSTVPDKEIEAWVYFASAGTGAIILAITVILLIRYGFFRRKTREEFIRAKKASMRLDFGQMNKMNHCENLDKEDY